MSNCCFMIEATLEPQLKAAGQEHVTDLPVVHCWVHGCGLHLCTQIIKMKQIWEQYQPTPFGIASKTLVSLNLRRYLLHAQLWNLRHKYAINTPFGVACVKTSFNGSMTVKITAGFLLMRAVGWHTKNNKTLRQLSATGHSMFPEQANQTNHKCSCKATIKHP